MRDIAEMHKKHSQLLQTLPLIGAGLCELLNASIAPHVTLTSIEEVIEGWGGDEDPAEMRQALFAIREILLEEAGNDD